MNIDWCDYYPNSCRQKPDVFAISIHGIVIPNDDAVIKMCEHHWTKTIKRYGGINREANGEWNYRDVIIMNRERFIKLMVII